MQEKYDKLILEKKGEIEAVKAKFDTDKVIGKSVQEAIVSTGIFERPLKFKGVISDANIPNRLSFISLIKEIDTALTKKYTEAEIIEAVFSAISLSSHLRSYLESKKDLTLPKLRKIIRSFYNEKIRIEIYNQLTSLAQKPNGTVQDFLFRALIIRQKVLFASQEADTCMSFYPSLTQGLFLYATETGLNDGNIRTRIRPLLQQPGVTDEELIEQVNKIMADETERNRKFGLVQGEGQRASRKN